MNKSIRQQRDREKRKLVEKRVRKTKRRWKLVVICVVIYLLSITPYALDLLRQPNLWNGILFFMLSFGGVLAIVLIAKYDRS